MYDVLKSQLLKLNTYVVCDQNQFDTCKATDYRYIYITYM